MTRDELHYKQNNCIRITVVQLKTVFGPKPLLKAVSPSVYLQKTVTLLSSKLGNIPGGYLGLLEMIL